MKNTELACRYIKIGIGLLMLAALSVVLTRPIIDFDFFWHLKTGQWIWENRQLPSTDIFSYTTPQNLSIMGQIILTAYWLSQTLYYLLYLFGGMKGIVLMRCLIAAALLYFVAKRRHGDDITFMGLIVIFIISVLGMFPLERPQVFSFLFFAVLLYLLEKILTPPEDNPTRVYIFLLPLTMLVWANSHSGFILGQVTIVLYLISEGMKFVHPSLAPATGYGYRRLLAAGVAGILFSLINPNSYHALTEIHRATMFHAQSSNIAEFVSTITFFKAYNQHAIALYWIVMSVTIVGLLSRTTKPDITQIFLLAGTGYFSFTQTRYVPFFLIAALPVASRYLSGKILLIPARALVLGIALFSAASFVWDERFNIDNLRSGYWVQEGFYPVEAAEFIAANDLRGNMYNFYDWGGYLIWRLGPERKVFTDGRILNENIINLNSTIYGADTTTIAGLPAWKSALDSFSIKYIVTPLTLKNLEVAPLVYALLSDRAWIPVFFGIDSIIFVKDIPDNSGVIGKYAIPKYDIMNYIQALTDTHLQL